MNLQQPWWVKYRCWKHYEEIVPGPLSLTRLVDFTSEEKRVITFAPLSFMQNKHKFIDLWPIKAQVSVLLYLSKFARWAEKRIGAQDLEIILWFTRFGWTFCSVVHFIRMYARQSKVKLVRINHCGLFAKRGLRFREKTTIYPAERIQSSL